MANINDIFLENKPGPYFVDSECIACDTCTDIAPKNFKLSNNLDHAYVFTQPLESEDLLACNEALKICPVNAIGLTNTVQWIAPNYLKS